MATASGESERHRDLKRRALIWAQAAGFTACALEVRVPRSRFLADVVACAPGNGPGEIGETAIFECKQTRADLLRDTADEGATRNRLRAVAARRSALERLVGAHLPHLRRGESLFPEYDDCSLEGIRHDGLRALRREEALLQAKLHGATKFARLRRYRSADRHYLVVATGVMEPWEGPAGWGVLEAAGNGLAMRRLPERVEAGTAARIAMLRALAMAGTRGVNARFEIDWDSVDRCRRSGLPQELHQC